MHIQRCGSKRYHGSASVISKVDLKFSNEEQYASNVEWIPVRQSVLIKITDVPFDNDGRTNHDYHIWLSLSDIRAILEALGHLASDRNASDLHKVMEDNIVPIVKILACATGLRCAEIRDNPASEGGYQTSPSTTKRAIPKKKITKRNPTASTKRSR